MEAMRVFKERKVVKFTTPADLVVDTVSKDQAEAANAHTRNLIFSEQCYPEWVRQCSCLRWLWDSGLSRRLESSDLGLWLSSHCPIFTKLLLLKIVLWVIMVWILSYLHMGLPCFLLALTYWLYEGPLQRALDWARSRLQGGVQTAPGLHRAQAAPGPRRAQ